MDSCEEFKLSDTVKLISADGLEFIIDRKCAMASGTMKNMLSSPGASGSFFTNPLCPALSPVPFVWGSSPAGFEKKVGKAEKEGLGAIILEKVCQYLYYKVRYDSAAADSSTEIPEFHVEPELALELLMAADFLDT
ncbi:MAG: BTB/POZ protein [Olpidium bornovanus]|uniref:Elongin-C n=1 Tax=Olpidium bornovanus TaxID=278681 RepID=A0A8H8DKB3_9FUNG|nr:MAG: BTB/POZ protein [Olpidium bornovanus]